MTLHKASHGFGKGPQWDLEAEDLRRLGLYAESGSEGRRNADGTISVRHLKAEGIGEYGPVHTFRRVVNPPPGKLRWRAVPRADESQCQSCGKVESNADGCEFPDGWYLSETGHPVCADCYIPPHNCEENAVPYQSDGPLGHGWECAICGKFLQAG